MFWCWVVWGVYTCCILIPYHEFEQTSDDSEGQGSLVCCSPWGHIVGHDLTTKQNPLSVILFAIIFLPFSRLSSFCQWFPLLYKVLSSIWSHCLFLFLFLYFRKWKLYFWVNIRGIFIDLTMAVLNLKWRKKIGENLDSWQEGNKN